MKLETVPCDTNFSLVSISLPFVNCVFPRYILSEAVSNNNWPSPKLCRWIQSFYPHSLNSIDFPYSFTTRLYACSPDVLDDSFIELQTHRISIAKEASFSFSPWKPPIQTIFCSLNSSRLTPMVHLVQKFELILQTLFTPNSRLPHQCFHLLTASLVIHWFQKDFYNPFHSITSNLARSSNFACQHSVAFFCHQTSSTSCSPLFHWLELSYWND